MATARMPVPNAYDSNAWPSITRRMRVEVGSVGSLEEILVGPGLGADGTTNVIGALKRAMATTGYLELKEFQRVEVIVAPHQKS